ncbi:MAG TPA: proline dehydrogenase family protein [Opitutales bacterium]|nr:proline dehydrogenase family protein [Opitutales bacterium]
MNSLQPRILSIGRSILEPARNTAESIFSKQRWYRALLDWTMQNPGLKTELFRFVDVLPSLQSSEEVVDHLKSYFSHSEHELPKIFTVGLGIGSFVPALTAAAIRKNVSEIAKIFITGENPKEAIVQLQKARKEGRSFTLDILGEATLSEKESADYHNRYLSLIEYAAEQSKDWPSIPLVDTDLWGPIPKINVSVKLSSLYSQISDKDWDNSKSVLKERLRPIFQKAQELGVFINLDMENYALKDLTFEVFEEMILDETFIDYPYWGIVIQAYLKDAWDDTQRMIALAYKRNVPFTVRLVKGAYWDYETVSAAQKDWPVPVFTQKAATDANYERCTQSLLDHTPAIRVALGSHNIRSLAAAMAYAESKNKPKNSFEIQMLYGMGAPFKRALADMGYRVREYATIGELVPGMAYLVRRLLENTSNESFLRHTFNEGQSIEVLLQDPRVILSQEPPIPHKNKPHFANAALLDFTLKAHREGVTQALEGFKARSSTVHPLIIGGKAVKTDSVMTCLNPSHPSQALGQVCMASPKDTEAAIQAAKAAFSSWSQTPAETRAQLLDRVAELMEAHRYDLIATQIKEVAKPWSEADGDIAEAIDFCRYYAWHMRVLSHPQKTGHVPGESSYYHYIPRGVTAVIAPWNFPLAILAGMTVAALVTGNTVVMKPAEQSSLVAAGFMELLAKTGLPPGVVNFLPGYGETVGRYLVSHPDVVTIAFTGSRAVGLEILQKASIVAPNQTHIKRCITELGGKNAIIIDSDADLDEAVAAVAASAFGFAGQKCSALSRVIILENPYSSFIERLIERMRSLKVSFAEDPACIIGPVIDADAQKRILETIEASKPFAQLSYQSPTPTEGYFVPPTLFTDVEPTSSLAREEIFGPVLSVFKVKTLDDALRLANDSPYGLTGGMFSRNPASLKRAHRELQVGNVYLNRGITGALVERHPFGGLKLSGVGGKTGGPDYLKQFMDARAVAENTLRRGFAPEED